MNPKRLRKDRFEKSTELFGDETVKMLLQAHEDALWILENLGVGCNWTAELSGMRQTQRGQRRLEGRHEDNLG